MEPFLKVITILIRFGMKMKEALKDKKIRLHEIMGLIMSAWGIWEPIQDFDEIREVLVNFTPERKAETIAHIRQELDLPDDELEEIVEDAVDLLLTNYEFIMKLINKT